METRKHRLDVKVLRKRKEEKGKRRERNRKEMKRVNLNK
jgi:hypothetical protein